MNRFWIVLGHTYASKVKTKSFIVSTAIMLVLLLIVSNLNAIIDFFDKDEADQVAVLDESGQFYQPLAEQLKTSGSELKLLEAESEKKAKKQVGDKVIKGYLIIRPDAEGLPEGTYKSDTIANSDIPGELSQALTTLKNQIYTETKLTISESQLSALYQPAVFKEVALDKSAKTEEELNAARGLVYVILFVIYFGVITYAGMIASEVAGEKTSRVMEILISSVSPVQQMFGKIAGIALLSLTQIVVFLVAGYFSIKKVISDLPDGVSSFIGFDDLSVSVLIYAVVFSMLGYLLYATLAAFLGSLVSRVEDVQQMISPMIWLVVIGFMMAMFGLTTPDAGFVKVTSFIPPFTPMLMFLRVGMVEVPVWEVALAIGLLVATIIAVALFGARVYRGGVLMYGQSSSIKSIKNALAMTKKD